ncbi:tape measure protein [Blastococcus sp. CT_GayMR16]|uniref:tape measure protein n=1 Tax=Blastococcus sp. CT_GayMR16 TaxID=2559607 RepID=UPI0010743C99|nr:tape measure protein [Blastococcus sp. CT_GayMR16]TFV83162.1 hypothetical protein E4P38_21130 [Blastococcus sp. CT_GayMR16]
MEENLGRTTIDVDVLLAPARKQLDELRSMTEKSAGDAGDAGGRSLGARLASGLGGALASIGKTLAVGVAAGAVALGGLGVAGAKAGLQTAASMEQANIAFTTMLGSGEKADAFLQDLAAFAAKTPFEFPELQTAASSLVSAGISADKVIPIMTSLGNATSGMGTGAEGVKRATVALQQMSAAGRITGEDLNQLRDAGVPVFDLLAAATGKSVEQVAELAQQGKLGREELDQLMGALESGAGLERFTGLMDAQSQSLNGMFSTLKDTVNMGLAKAIEPLIPMIKNGLGGATSWVADMMPRLASGIATVASWGQVAYGILFQGDYKGGLVAGLSEDSRAVDVLFRIREAALAVFEAVRSGDFSDLGGEFGSAASAGGGVLSMLKSVGGVLPDVATLVSAAGDVVGFLADNADQLSWVLPVLAAGFLLWKAGQTAANIAALASLPIQAAQVASNFALASAQRALAFQMGVLTGVQRTTMLGSIAAAASTAAAWVAAQVRTVASLVAMAAGFVARGAVMVASAAATAAGVVASWVMMGVRALVSGAQMAAAWVVAMGPVGWVIAAVVALVALIVANWDTVVAWTKKAWEWIVGAVKAGAEWIWNLFLNWTLVGLIIKHWDAIKSAFSNGVNSAVSFVKELPGKVLGALGDLGSLLWNAGKNMIQGLLDGAGSLLRNIGRFFLDLVPGWIRGPFEAALGISSPSKVFAGYGGNIGQGLVKGMLGQTSLVKRATMSLAAAAVAVPLMLATPGVAAGDIGATGAFATAGRAAAAAAAAGSSQGAAGGDGPVLQVHAYEGQSVRSLATEVVNLGTWATKER